MGQFDPEYVAVEEEQRAQRHVLRRGRDPPLDGEVREELPYLLGAHLFGVALPVKEDEAPDPV